MGLLDLLLPPACSGCGRSTGALLCGGCRSHLRPPSDPVDRFAVADAGVVVGDHLSLAMAAFVYEGPMRRALASLKYGGASRIAPLLGEMAAPTLERLRAVTGPAVLVPIPVHAERLLARGYNQAALLATDLGRRARLPLNPCLVRTRATTRQHRLDRAARRRNLRDAFGIAGDVPRVAILVDDIITTTATLDTCAEVLVGAGCTTVYALAIAREV